MMKPLNWKLLIIPILGAAVTGYLLTQLLLTRAYSIPTGSWLHAAFMLILSAGLLYLGLGVRSSEEKPAKYQGSLAFGIALAANAAAWTAALLVGWYAGITLPLLTEGIYLNLREIIAENLASASSCGVFLGVAIVVENWCRLSGDDQQSPRASNPTAV